MLRPSLPMFTTLAIALCLAACGSSPSGTGGGGETFTLALMATELVVQEDCDDIGGDRSARAGDFFIKVELWRVDGSGSTLLGEAGHELVQLEDGESQVVGLETLGDFTPGGGAQLEARVNIYENDTGDVRHFDQTDTMTFEYDASAGCWVYAGDDSCLGGLGGNLAVGVVRVRDTGGDPCTVDLGWRVRLLD